MSEGLELELRKKIYQLLIENPGLNISTLADFLNISVQLADYHLHYMVEAHLVNRVQDGAYTRFYVEAKLNPEDKKILTVFYQENMLKIILFLLNHPNSKPKEICEAVQISPALLSYYLRKLVKYNLIVHNESGEKKQFSIVNQEHVLCLLIQYKPKMLLQRFHDTWLTDLPFSDQNKTKKK